MQMKQGDSGQVRPPTHGFQQRRRCCGSTVDEDVHPGFQKLNSLVCRNGILQLGRHFQLASMLVAAVLLPAAGTADVLWSGALSEAVDAVQAGKVTGRNW
jgi:hypothetical protein